MPTTVLIDGNMVDVDDPCAVASALRAAELKVASGGGVVMTRFDENHEVRWGRANLDQLGELRARYERACNANSGQRTRYAKRLRFIR